MCSSVRIDGINVIIGYLQGAAKLGQLGLLGAGGKAALKDLILRNDRRVMAAVEVFEVDHDVDEMLDTLKRIARRAVEDA